MTKNQVEIILILKMGHPIESVIFVKPWFTTLAANSKTYRIGIPEHLPERRHTDG